MLVYTWQHLCNGKEWFQFFQFFSARSLQTIKLASLFRNCMPKLFIWAVKVHHFLNVKCNTPLNIKFWYPTLACVSHLRNLAPVGTICEADGKILVHGLLRTQKITGSVFWISLHGQPEWQIDNQSLKKSIMAHTQTLVHGWRPR